MKTAQDRKKAAASSTYSKVKPVVVKHMLKDNIAPIAEHKAPSVMAQTAPFSDTSFSPRFYGAGVPPYYGKPNEVSRDLIQSLEYGMSALQPRKENIDPQFSERSGLSGSPGGPDPFQELTTDELDRLKAENIDRIQKIEEAYFKKREDMKKVKEIMQERAEQREHKLKIKDSSLSYPTYGRGIDPDQNMDTYMINKSLC